MDARQKATHFVDEYMVHSKKDGLEYRHLIELLKLLLLEQDRDTRHACAEQILEIEDKEYERIWRDDAYSAVINCRGGVK